MSTSVEIEAKNVEKAIEKACNTYQVDADQLAYEVISYGSSGIFGLGKSRNAKIRIQLPEHTPRLDNVTEGAAETAVHPINDAIEAADTDPSTDVSSDHDVSIALGRDVLQKIVDAITTDATVVAATNHNGVIYQVDGGNAAMMIGKHGQTLEAIQNIVDKVVNKHIENRIHVQIDIAGYLKNRAASLQKQAEKLAEKCQRIGKPVSLGVMNAHDRRIVHLALKENQAVRTQSIGDGAHRKLMIYPKRQSPNRRKRSSNSSSQTR